MKWFIRILLLIVLLVGGGIWFGLSRVNHILERYTPEIESYFSKKLGAEVKVQKLTLSISSSPKLTLSAVEVVGVGSAETIEATVRILPLISRRLEIASFNVIAPIIQLPGIRKMVVARRSEQSNNLRVRTVGFSFNTDTLSQGNFYFDIASISITRGRVIDPAFTAEEIALTTKVKFRDGERISLENLSLSCFLNKARLGMQGDIGVNLEERNLTADDLLVSYDGNDVRLQGDMGYESGSGRITISESKFEAERISSYPYFDFIRSYNVQGKFSAKGAISVQRFSPRVNMTVTIEEGGLRYHDLPITGLRGSTQIEGSLEGIKLVSNDLKATVKELPVAVNVVFSYPEKSGNLELEVKNANTDSLMAIAEVFRAKREPIDIHGVVHGKLKIQFEENKPLQYSGSDITLVNVKGSYKGQAFEQMNGHLIAGTDDQVILKDFGITLGGESFKINGSVRTTRGDGELSVKSSALPIAVVKAYVPSIPFTEGELSVDSKVVLEGWNPQFQGQFSLKEGVYPTSIQNLSISKISLTTLISRAGAQEQFFAVRDATGLLTGGEAASLSLQGVIRGGRAQTIEIKRGEGGLLGGTLTAQGTIGAGGQIMVALNGIDIQRLSKLIPSIQGKLTGTLAGQITHSQGAGGSVARFDIEKGLFKGINVTKYVIEKLAAIPLVGDRLMMSLPQEFASYMGRSDTEISKAHAALSLEQDMLYVNPLSIEFDSGELQGEGSVDLRSNELRGSLIASLRQELSAPIIQKNSGLRSFLNNRGMLQLPIKIQGTLQDPSFIPDTKTIGVVGIEGALFDALEKKLRKRRGSDDGRNAGGYDNVPLDNGAYTQ